MTFAEIHWLPITIHLLQSIFVIDCGLMVLLILMQRPKQEGLGAAFGGGVTDQVFGARTTNVLQRGTVYLGSLFFIIALALAVLVGQQNKTVKTVTKADSAAKVEKAKAVVPPAPVMPKSLTEELPPAEVVPPDSPAPADVPPDASVPTQVTPPVTPVIPPSETAPTSPPTESLPVTPPVAPPPADKAPQL